MQVSLIFFSFLDFIVLNSMTIPRSDVFLGDRKTSYLPNPLSRF